MSWDIVEIPEATAGKKAAHRALDRGLPWKATRTFNMKTKLLTYLMISAACLAGVVSAQTVQTATPAPAVPEAAPAVASAPNQTVYTQRLPSVDELSKAAVAQGVTVERIEQNASQITATYRYANGQTNVVAYLLLPTANSTVQVVTPTTPAPTVYTQAPTVYYAPAPAPRVVYYDDYSPRYYYSSSYPRYYYPPVSIGLGFGFRSGGYYGGYRGGYGGHHRH